jgi:2-polyprenyl-6-methoxyphenol hydroxylase-like FAD-dependent oxidoreductase
VAKPANCPSRFGYGSRFLRRSDLLQILYGAIQNKEPVMTSTRLGNIEESEHHSKLVSIDGRWVTADVVVGADGVHSPTRRCVEQFVGSEGSKISETSMAPVAERQTPAPDLTNVRSAREAQFTCVFGTSSPVHGLNAGECFAVYRSEATVLVLTGKGGTVFWFVFEHIDEADVFTEQPSDNTTDIENAGRSVAHLQLSTGATFGDIFASRTSARKTILVEGLADHWHANRMVIIGDAAHTVSPSRLE